MERPEIKNALVVGASGTLGSAIARELLARGCNLGLHYHANQTACATIAASALNTTVHSYAADFRSPDAPAQLAAAFMADFSSVDVVVWAAGIVRDAPLLTLKEEDLRDVLTVNLKSCFLLLKALSRQFMKQKSGSVVALSSHAAVAGRAGGTAYAMAQSGLLALLKSTAREWGPFNIQVNAVIPPFIPDSGMGRGASPEFLAAQEKKRVLKTHGDEAAALAKFVADIAAAKNISGQVLNADSRVI